MRVDAEITHGRSLAWPLGAALAAAAMLVFLAFQTALTAAMFSAAATFLTALSFVALSRGAPGASCGVRRVNADTRGLSVDGELVIPRRAIKSARVNDEPNGHYSVIVESRGVAPARIVHVESARIAQALADTLEQQPGDVAVFDALPPWAHRMRWLAIVLGTSPWILVNLLRYAPTWMIICVLSLYGLLALPILLPQKIAIGEDGILLRWAGRRRFVPFSTVRQVHVTALGIELDLRDEPDVEIRLTHRPGAALAQRATLLDRIEEGLAHHRALTPGEDEALLARGERRLDDWIVEMTTLGSSGAHGYRTVAMPRERLWGIVENPAAHPSARQGAALALRARLDDEERERLSLVAQKTASPRLRIAIDAITKTPDVPRLRVALEASDDDDEHEWDRARRSARVLP